MDLHHHTLKKGFMQEVLDPLNAYDDPEGYRWALRNKYGAHEYALPEEGIMRAQREGEQISKDLLTTADNAVIWLISSKELRTQETNNIIYNEIKDKARNDPDYAGTQLFNMFKYKTLDNVLRAVNQQGGRIVIANQEDVPVMGFNARWDMDKNTEILKERYGGDEGAMLRDWLEDYYLQDEVGARPYEVADGFKVFIRQKQEEFARLFPNRPLVIGAIGHSWEIDAAIVGLIGETFSRAQIDKMGGMIGIMEGAKIVIGTDAEGNKINYLQYRDKRYPLNLEVEEYEYNPNERYIYYGKQVEPPKAIRQRQEGTRENGRQRERGQIEFGTESEALRALISFVYPNEPDMDEGDFLTAFGCRSSQELARVNEASDVIELTDNILNGNQALRPNPEPTIGYPRGRGGGRGGGRHR
ncbi:hypothetical protein COT77_01590 [Candidatus Berkelbacteria bacterium CG10_big_fil_rev_8_21_14_0_10_41_12]|uniref:Uncharacterized protein n=1 Tax=Candidatus Berkelbacteria bacterium CG10_big_fil_rev_8_21_14_0_10_41_12 TaxID=1974513 RepID=A0A2M6WXA8_9BACT|nr:MAG: hypothetical protein COT77_01590 [Candidatus Berkelbacteria bacterium CG10_big_fil_rev_8_21_14_0_10_41_12]